MTRYVVEYYMKSKVIADEPHGPYRFNVTAEDLNSASRHAVRDIYWIDRKDAMSYVWNAKISSPAKERREILRERGWLVDIDTGKVSRSLEERAKK